MSYVSRPVVVSLISDLVRIDSVTPWLVVGGAGEKDVVDYFLSMYLICPSRSKSSRSSRIDSTFLRRCVGLAAAPRCA